MKSKFLLPVFLLVLTAVGVHAQTTNSNYVVIGAFRLLDNAAHFTVKANKEGFTALYAINPSRKLYYVYVLSSDDMRKAYNLLIKIRVETEYKDAWVYTGKLGNEEPEPVVKPEPKIEPVIAPVIEVPKDTIKTQPPKIDSALIKPVEPPKPVEVKKPKGKPFYFHVVSADDGKELSGDLQLQEAVGASQYQTVKSGEVVYLEAPKNKKGSYNVIAQVAGYKQSNLTFVYASPTGEKGSNNEDVITLKLAKAKKGDYIDFKNVHFFKNTSVMQAESQNELDGLVNLMKERPKYKIKIYGYCNGKQKRESYTMGTSTNFFAMDPKGNRKETISSKALSLARAETVKAYLVQHEIDPKRISTKGEGGSVPLYPEGGTLGQYNDRVEIEFVKN